MVELINPDRDEIACIAEHVKQQFEGRETAGKLTLIRDWINKNIETGFTQPFLYKKRVSLRTDLEMLQDREADMLEKCLLFYSIATKCGFNCKIIGLMDHMGKIAGATIRIDAERQYLIDPNNRPKDILHRFHPQEYTAENLKKVFLEARKKDPILRASEEPLLLQQLKKHSYWLYCPDKKKRIVLTIHADTHGFYSEKTRKYTIVGIITGRLNERKKVTVYDGGEIWLGPGPLLKHTFISNTTKKAVTSLEADHKFIPTLLRGYTVRYEKDDATVERLLKDYVSDPRLIAALDRIADVMSKETDSGYA